MKWVLGDIKLKISLLVVLGALLIFSCVRVGIFLNNLALFSSLSLLEIVSAFFNGFRFDFYVIALFLGPVIFILNLPILTKFWTKLWTTVLLVQMLCIVGFLISDFIYFPQVGRHITEEIIQITTDWEYVVSYAFTQLWWVLLLLIAFGSLAVYFAYKSINEQENFTRSWKKTFIVLLIIVIGIILGLRGHLGGGKALGVTDVYKYVPSSQGAALALNGVFTAYQVGRKGTQNFTNNYPLSEALQNAQQFLIASDENILDENYPLMRQREPTQRPSVETPNILVILLEGWNPQYIDGMSHKHFGVTPVFDKMIERGVLFTNAYAAGQRSIVGFGAVLAGVPLIPGLPNFGYGLELVSLSTLPRHFSQAGYYTFFAQTSPRDSYRMCALAYYLGMQESFGREDMPKRLPYKGKAPFGYDYDAFQLAADRIAAHAGQPFMGLIFTGITHEPFTDTLPQFHKYPYDNWEHGFLNTLFFADWSIGELLARAKKEGWFDNTIFVFVADHTAGKLTDDTIKSRFQIPLLVYAPKYFATQKIDRVVSQLDLIPALYKMANLTPSYTALGRDMLNLSTPGAAFVSDGTNIGLITSKGSILHNGEKLVKTESYAEDFDPQAAQQLLLSLDKSAYTLLKENRWYNATGKETL